MEGMKDEKRFAKLLNHSRTKQIGTYLQKFVARDLQKAIRAEAGAFVGTVRCVIDGEMDTAHSAVGRVICVTCGKEMPWSAKGTHSGHFLGGRSSSIVLEEVGIHPQCARCNEHDSGASEAYQVYMLAIYGQKVVDELRMRKNGYTEVDGERVEIEPLTREEMVEKRIGYLDRLKVAETIIRNGGPILAAATKTEVVEYKPRQLTLEFDYEASGLTEVQKGNLEDYAQDILDAAGNARYHAVNESMNASRAVFEAKKEFKGSSREENWADWCKRRLGMDRSTADRHCLKWKALQRVDRKVLAMVPLSRLDKISQKTTKSATRSKVLKLAKDGYVLTPKDVDEVMGGDEQVTETKLVAKIPSTRQEVKEALAKRVKSLVKKVNGLPVAEDIAGVLHEIADELGA